MAGGGKTWLDGQNAWLGVGTCSWGLKHVAGDWQMCIIEQISEKTCRKKKENVPRAQTTCLALFGPMGVETGSWEVETHGCGWKDVARWSKCVAGGQNM